MNSTINKAGNACLVHRTFAPERHTNGLMIVMKENRFYGKRDWKDIRVIVISKGNSIVVWWIVKAMTVIDDDCCGKILEWTGRVFRVQQPLKKSRRLPNVNIISRRRKAVIVYSRVKYRPPSR